MNAIKNRVDYLKENGYNFDISTIIEKAFEYWKKIILPTLLVSVIVAAFFFLFYVLFLSQYFGGFDLFLEEFKNNPDDAMNMINNFDYISKSGILNFIIMLIISPLLAGILLCIREADITGSTNATTVFKGYSGKYIGNILGYTIVLNIVTTAITLGFSYWNPDAGGIFSLIFSVIIYALCIFALPLILFGEMNFLNAIFSSIGLSLKKFGMIFLLIIIGFFIIIIPSVITCGLGFLIFHSISTAITYSTYKEVVGFEEDSEVSEIGKAL